MDKSNMQSIKLNQLNWSVINSDQSDRSVDQLINQSNWSVNQWNQSITKTNQSINQSSCSNDYSIKQLLNHHQSH